MNLKLRSTLALTASTLALISCGGSDSADGNQAEAPAIDSSIVTDIPREPLTEEDLDGLTLANLSVEIPWTLNSVGRDPAPAAPRAHLEAVELSGHDGFDRMMFTFSATTPFPGYEIRVVDAGYELICGDEGVETRAVDQRSVVVRLHPADTGESGQRGVERGSHGMSLTRLADSDITCADAGQVVWVSGLTEGEELRVLEFRSPQRLLVDIR